MIKNHALIPVEKIILSRKFSMKCMIVVKILLPFRSRDKL